MAQKQVQSLPDLRDASSTLPGLVLLGTLTLKGVKTNEIKFRI